MYYPSLKKLVSKSCEKVSFCYCTEITIALKKTYPPKTYMRSIRSSGVGNCLLLHARGWGIAHRERKNCKSPEEGMVTGQIEPCITSSGLTSRNLFVQGSYDQGFFHPRLLRPVVSHLGVFHTGILHPGVSSSGILRPVV